MTGSTVFQMLDEELHAVSAQMLDRATTPAPTVTPAHTSAPAAPARRSTLRDLLTTVVVTVDAARAVNSARDNEARRRVVERFVRDLPR